MNDEHLSCLFLVRGRVQGVGFRHFVWRTATELGVQGWVRNLSDGSVEVVAWGSDEKLDFLSSALGKGPRWSHVDSVVREQSPESEFPDGRFSIRS